MWRKLMADHLEFPTFFAQGGDMGSILSSWMAFDYPEHVGALHLNSVGSAFLVVPEVDQQTPEEQEWVTGNSAWRRPQDGYRTQQGTRPHTLAYGLTDSPVGLLTWIIEKFQEWTVPGETRDPPFDQDELLSNVMLYWLAGPGTASWYYISFFLEKPGCGFPDACRVEVPTGLLLCPRDTVLPPPDSVIQRSFNMVRRTDAADGGHFVALEQPDLFVEDVRSFFRAYR
jgi:pimeloyl-ACP methyl ester carboxylesterase